MQLTTHTQFIQNVLQAVASKQIPVTGHPKLCTQLLVNSGHQVVFGNLSEDSRWLFAASM